MQGSGESCCIIDYEGLKKRRQERMKSFIENPDKPRIGERDLTVTLKENFLKEVSVREFSFISDEPEDIGGTNKGPRPMEYFLAGAALCEMSLIVGNAIDTDIKLNNIEIRARGRRDIRGMHAIGGVQPGFQDVIYDVKIDSEADEESIKTLVARAESRCPGYNSLVRPVKVTTNIILKGKQI
ncbi:MAG: OsmC family protein [Nitrososphaerales archaeon]